MLLWTVTRRVASAELFPHELESFQESNVAKASSCFQPVFVHAIQRGFLRTNCV
jgi:hypothetical protein